MSLSIGVILGSSRPNRSGEAVAQWFMEQTKNFKEATFTFIDLKDVNLPMFDETTPPLMHQYANDHTKAWAEKIASFDAFIVVTPEYNHSFPAVLKNAFDYVNLEWNKKAIGFVSYGATSGGLRAVEQLRLVAVELQMANVREQISIPFIWEAINPENGSINPDYVKGTPELLIKDVLWWGEALKAARKK